MFQSRFSAFLVHLMQLMSRNLSAGETPLKLLSLSDGEGLCSLDPPSDVFLLENLMILNQHSISPAHLVFRCNWPEYTPGRSIPGYIKAYANLYPGVYFGPCQFIPLEAAIYPGYKLAQAKIYTGII